ncbi:MAG: TonB-dependent receptor [Dysgonamonadaceae bacterium]|jgi:iron complex outermembrane receptor protein|nr:TonB-dependent receptor [Dysgonamonadaceae bacterium]
MYKKKEKKSIRFKRFVRKSYSVFNSLHKVISIGVLSGSALVCAHAASVNPVERVFVETAKDSIPQKELDEIVVSASKADLPLSRAAKIVTVISRQDVERAPVQSIQDLLNYAAGVDVLQRGRHGVQADISLRGGSFDQVAILLNGINLSNPQTGHYSFDIPVNLSDIERIEIVKGSSSLIFGANALAGAINIITKKDSETSLYAKAEGGMHGLFAAEARGAYKIGQSVHRLSAGRSHSDGYIANSDYDIANVLWQSRFGIDGSTLDFQLGYNDKAYGANTFYSAAYPNQFEDTRSVFASVKGETNGRLKIIPMLYWNRHFDEYQLIRGDESKVKYNHHRSDVFGINLNFQYAWALGILSFGGEFRNEGILSTVLGETMPNAIGKYARSYNRSNISQFVEHSFLWDKVTLSLGGLLNYNTAIVNNFAFYPSVNTSFRVADGSNLFASWNKATRMPTFTDLYYNTPTHAGNDSLLAEKNQSFEAGIKYRNPYVGGSLSLFYNVGENLIDWVQPDAEGKWQAINLSAEKKLKSKGFEANVSLFLDRIFDESQAFRSLQVGYTYLSQDNNSGQEINNPVSMYVCNYLKNKLTATLNHDLFLKGLSVSWNLRFQDRAGSYRKYIDKSTSVKTEYSPFAILDAKMNYARKNMNVFVNLNNIFNRTYVDLGNIPQPGFWLTGGIAYQIR